jgi:hypothetical protein
VDRAVTGEELLTALSGAYGDAADYRDRYAEGSRTALSAIEARLVGDDGSPVAADGESPGELQVRGPVLFPRVPQPAGRHRGGVHH